MCLVLHLSRYHTKVQTFLTSEQGNEAFIFQLKLVGGPNRQSKSVYSKGFQPTPSSEVFSAENYQDLHPRVVFLIYKLVATLHKPFSSGQASLPQSQRGLLSPAGRAAVPTPKRTLKGLGVRKGTAWVSFRQPAPKKKKKKNHLFAAAASQTAGPPRRSPDSGGRRSPTLHRGLKGFRGRGEAP